MDGLLALVAALQAEPQLDALADVPATEVFAQNIVILDAAAGPTGSLTTTDQTVTWLNVDLTRSANVSELTGILTFSADLAGTLWEAHYWVTGESNGGTRHGMVTSLALDGAVIEASRSHTYHRATNPAGTGGRSHLVQLPNDAAAHTLAVVVAEEETGDNVVLVNARCAAWFRRIL